ncbi:ExbD/TolR family protein [Stygiobacter electus]|jgi:biopolymer transport protein ExbD|uniref:Biopolymer transporter ExbD n=1 Tax=Stygiobacter electus TaxID=3032292 RepID=A0AAE3TDT4_9BACT|nr:biopolymer transporter ExbD [Stygiobacter electus]MDF1613305.1 biopolymer transporter ExbD [Stygiobacter electus]
MRRNKIDEKEFSDINITPLTDVVMVLLLIFMIASPFLIVGAFKVKLPKATTAESVNNKSIEVFLDSSNKIYLDNKNITMPELLLQIQLKLKINPEQSVIIKADKEVFHGNFISLLDELKKAGVTKFLIGTSKKEQ